VPVTGAIYFNVTDAGGLPYAATPPQVTVVSGGGQVSKVNTVDPSLPGNYSVDIVMGTVAGPIVFQIAAGKATASVTITGQP
jgi:hypothetical protein